MNQGALRNKRHTLLGDFFDPVPINENNKNAPGQFSWIGFAAMRVILLGGVLVYRLEGSALESIAQRKAAIDSFRALKDLLRSQIEE